MRSDGVETRPLRQMTGDAEFDEVFLTDVAPPGRRAARRARPGLGDRHGHAHQRAGLHRQHGASRSRSASTAIQALAAGEGLDGPSRASGWSQLYSRGKAYLSMTQRQGPMASVGSSLGKLGMTGFMFDLAELRADIAGADAMLVGPESDGLLAAPGGWFGGGTSQVQRNIIGERILGLPREPRPG